MTPGKNWGREKQAIFRHLFTEASIMGVQVFKKIYFIEDSCLITIIADAMMYNKSFHMVHSVLKLY